MALHLLKLCVGAESVESFQAWTRERVAESTARSGEAVFTTTTRMIPKRLDDLLPGGSLYWVVRGMIAVRAELVDIRPFADADGVKRCHLVMQLPLVPLRPRPCRPFQGWRYLSAEAAPPDLAAPAHDGAIPQAMHRELMELCLL